MPRFKQLSVALVALVATSGIARAAEDGDPSHPGIISVDWSELFNRSEPTVSVNVGRPLLRFATSVIAGAGEEGSEEISALIGQVKSLRVEVFDNLGGDDVRLTISPTVARLKQAGWENLVRVREGGSHESVDVLLNCSGDSITGLAVFVAGSDEFVFVNIAGDIDPEGSGKLLGGLAKRFGDGKLDLEKILNTEALEEMIEGAVEKHGGEHDDGDHDDDGHDDDGHYGHD